MSYAALKLRLLPTSPEISLEKLKREVKARLEKFKARIHAVEEQAIGFGIRALIVTIAWPEQLSTELAEKELLRIKEISSLDVLDYRRAFG